MVHSKGVLKIIVDCCDNCEFGLKFKKHFSKPVVRFPVLHRFNEYVSMDLKEVEKGNVWILYLIDASTRYTAACWIKRKKSSTVIYFRCRWIIYEHLVNFIAIVAENLQMMYSVKWTKKLDIETGKTPAESPFSNGELERNNKVLCEGLMKTMEDAKCEMRQL